MDYGRNDDRGWTVKREKPEDGPIAWIYAHAILFVVCIAVGVVGGYLWPLILANLPGPSAHQREMNRGTTGRRHFEDRVKDVAREEVRREGRDMAVRDTAESAHMRAVLGGVLGAVAAVGVAVASRKKKKR